MVDHTEKCPLSISGFSNSYEDPQHTILSQIWRRFQKNYRKWRPKPSWVKTFLIFDLPGIGRHFQLHPPKEQVILHLLYQGERLKSCRTEVIEVSWYPPGGRRFPPGGTSISPRGDVLSWYPRGDLVSVSLFLVVPPGVPRPQVPPGGRRRQKSETGVSEWKPAVSKSGEGRFQNGNRPFPEWDETH